jgi:quinol monooxygenase YgiN
MSDSSVRIVALIKAKPDQVEPLKEILMGQIEPTRAEDGCVSYELMQNIKDETDFAFVEQWRDLGAVKAHSKSEHLQKAREARTGMLDGDPVIGLYTKIA